MCSRLGRVTYALEMVPSAQRRPERAHLDYDSCVPSESPSKMRRAGVWLVLVVGWIAVASVAGWWARSQDIEWALDESARGPNYLLISSLVYWGAAFCVALVIAAREGPND